MSSGGFGNRDNRLVLGGFAFVVVAVLGTAILIGLRGHPTTPARSACPASGCAVVSLNRSLPPLTVFYGVSCAGPRGSWFFNAVEGGGNDQLRPSYSLRWTFASNSNIAKPNGTITFHSTPTTDVSVTLQDGVLDLRGVRKPNSPVSATGTLEVELSGLPDAPVLKFTETGLLEAEGSLGLVSPFDAGGQPLIVPIQTVKTVSGC